MQRVKVLDLIFKEYISNKDIVSAIDKIATTLNNKYKNTEDIPILISTLNGAFIFTSELVQRLDFCVEICFAKYASYIGTEQSNEIKQLIGLAIDVKDRTVIILEDIVDSGNTIEKIHKELSDRGAQKIEVCTLLFKPEAYKKDLPIDYYAIEIKNEFVVGYGLDYNGLGRQYKDIYILDQDNETQKK